MIKLSFSTIKLGKYIREVKTKVKNTDLIQESLVVYGVTNKEGITVTNNKASDDLGNYIVLGENQFAYNPYRINVGSIGLTSNGTFGVVSPAYVVFETTTELDSEFLFYYLKSQLGINLIKWYGDRGGVRSALRYNELKEIDIPNLTLEQQLSVLDKVKNTDLLLTELINNNDISLDYIFSLRQSILQQAVEGNLCEQNPNDEPAIVLLEKIRVENKTLISKKKIKKQKILLPITEEEKPFELPYGWEWCRFESIIEIASNLVMPDEYKDYTHIAPDNIEKATGRLLKCSTVGEDDVRSFNHVFFKNQIIYSKIRPALRKTVIAPFDGLCSADMYPLNVSVNSKYILTFLLTDFFTNQVLKSDNRVKMPKTNQVELAKVIIPLPPLAEQQRIVEKVDRLMVLCDELANEVLLAKKYVSQLMEAVLQEAFSTQKQKAKKDNITEFVAAMPKEIKHQWSAAARGTMKEGTWVDIINKANELFEEE